MTSKPVVTLTFINKHRNPVNLYWVNGRERLHATLDVGERYEQGSQPNLVWVARDKGTERLITRTRAKADAEIEIIPRNRRLPVRRAKIAGIDTTHRPPAPTQNFALEFDGDNDMVVVPHSDSLNLRSNWTLEAWVYRRKQSTEQVLLEKYDGQMGGYSLRIGANNRLQGGAYSDTQFIYGEGETSLRARRWYHVAVSYDTDTDEILCYVNGRQETTTLKIYDSQNRGLNTPPTDLTKRATRGPLKIGTGHPDHSRSFYRGQQAGNHFNGRLDSIRIWNTTRSSAEISSAWKQILDPSAESGLVAYYRFDEPLVLGGEDSVETSALETVKDSTSNANHGRFGSANRLKNVRIWDIARSEVNQPVNNADDSAPLVNWPLAENESEPDFSGTELLALNQDFTIEASLDLGSFDLADDYQQVLFKRDSWSLDLQKIDGKPHIRFRYSYLYYKRGADGKWPQIAGQAEFDQVPKEAGQAEFSLLLKDDWTGWVDVAVQRDKSDASSGLALYVNGTKTAFNQADAHHPIKHNRQQIRIGGEGKPKWVASDLLLLNGLNFDGVDDHVNLGHAPHFDQLPFTLECWVKSAQGGTNGYVFSKSNTAGNRRDYGLIVRTSDAKVRLQYTRNDSNINVDWTDVPLDDGAWHHLALVVAGDVNTPKATLFIDGIDKGEQGLSGPMALTANTVLWLGKRQGGNLPFEGLIDEVRFWRVARTGAQIQAYLQRQVPPTHHHLAGLWSLDEGTGAVAYDSTRHGNHGLLGDGVSGEMPTWLIPISQADRGLKFDGVDDYVDLGSDPSFELQPPFTIETWVKQLDSDNNGYIIAKSNVANDRRDYAVFVQGTQNRVRFQYNNNGNNQNLDWNNIDLADGVWHHVALVIEDIDSNLKANLFIDGLDKGEKNLPGLMTVTTGTALWLGKRQPDTQRFNGLLAEVRIWQVARTAAQIQANMLGQLDTQSEDLVGYWPLDDNRGQIASDRSQNLNHGQLLSGSQNSTPQWVQTSPIQFEGYTFDGKGSHIEIDNSDSLNQTSDITISAWIQPNQFLGLQGLVSKRLGGRDCQYALSLDGEKLRFDLNNNGQQYTLNGGRLNEGWHHVAVTMKTVKKTVKRHKGDFEERILEPAKKEGGSQYRPEATTKIIQVPILEDVEIVQPKIKLFVDGMLVAGGRAKLAAETSDAPVQIGVLGGQIKKHFFHGRIDSVVIRNRALSQSDLQSEMHTRFGSDAPSHVVGYWQLSPDLSETVEDQSEQNNDGRLKYHTRVPKRDQTETAIPLEAKSIYGQTPERKALHLTGSNHATVSNYTPFTGAAPRTVEAWIKMDDTKFFDNPTQTILHWGNSDAGQQWALQTQVRYEDVEVSDLEVELREAVLRLDVGTGYIEGQTNLVDGRWHHIAVSFTGSNVTEAKLYVDGVLQTVPADKQASHTVNTAAGEPFQIGKGLNNTRFYGDITEVRLWDVALEQAQIRARQNRFLLGSEANLMAYWPCLEGTGNQIADHSSFGRILSFEGENWVTAADTALTLDTPLTCLVFDGKTDYALLPTASPIFHKSKELTFETWLRVDAFTAQGTLFSPAEPKEGDMSLQINEAGLTFAIQDRLTWTASWGGDNPQLALGQWYHLTVIYRGTRQGFEEVSPVEVYLSGFELMDTGMEDDADEGNALKTYVLSGTLLKGSQSVFTEPSADSDNGHSFSNSWGQILTSSIPSEKAEFGHSVALNENWALIGAIREDIGGATDAGRAFLIRFDQTTGKWDINSAITLEAPTPESGGLFGWSVALNDTWALVGEKNRDINGPADGRAYLYQYDEANERWDTSKTTILEGLSTESYSYFGHSVALSKRWALIGSQEKINSYDYAGRAYLFSYNEQTGQWDNNSPIATLQGYPLEANAKFGTSVAVNESWALVGAPNETVEGFAAAGRAYLFHFDPVTSQWDIDTPIKLKASDLESSALFGNTVALSENWALVGATHENVDGQSNSGCAYLFRLDPTTGKWDADNPIKLQETTPTASKYFGSSVAINENMALVGGYYKAYLFRYDEKESTWATGSPISILGNTNYFGLAGSLNKTRALVGEYAGSAILENGETISRSGQAYVFPLPRENLQLLQSEDPKADAQFGDALALTENWAVIGASSETVDDKSEAGRVYLYAFDQMRENWIRSSPTALQAPMPQAGARFGISAALSGPWLLVGAYREHLDEIAGDNEAGRAYLYRYNAASRRWDSTPTATFMGSQTETYGAFGATVAITDHWALVGASYAGGANTGRAYLFRYDETSQSWKTEPEQTLDLSGQQNANFAKSLTMTKEWILVGAPGQDFDKGRAYLYAYDKSTQTWISSATALAPPETATGRFGSAVALAKGWALIGASHEDIDGLTDAGRAYLYRFDKASGGWDRDNPIPLEAPTPQANANFGISVALVEGWALVGAYREDIDGETDTGRAYLYRFDDILGRWDTTDPTEISLDNLAEGSELGFKVALNSVVALVGSPKATLGGVNQAGLVVSEDIPRPLFLGRGPLATTGNSHFQGRLAETRFWQAAQHSLSLDAYRQRRLFGSEPNLAAYWPMGEYDTQTLEDYSLRPYDGHLLGPTWQPMEDPLIAEDTESDPIKPAVRLLPPIIFAPPSPASQAFLEEKEAFYGSFDTLIDGDSAAPIPLLPTTVTSLSAIQNVPNTVPPIPAKPVESVTPNVISMDEFEAIEALHAHLIAGPTVSPIDWMAGFDDSGLSITVTDLIWIYQTDPGGNTAYDAKLTLPAAAKDYKPIGISIKGTMTLPSLMKGGACEVVLDLTQGDDGAGNRVWSYRLLLNAPTDPYSLSQMPLIEDLNIPGLDGLVLKKPSWSTGTGTALNPTDDERYTILTSGATVSGSVKHKEEQVYAKERDIENAHSPLQIPDYLVELDTLNEELAELQAELVALNSKKLLALVIANADDDPTDGASANVVAGVNAFGAINCAEAADGNLIKDFIHGVCGVTEVQYYLMRNGAGDYIIELTTTASTVNNGQPSGLFAPVNVLFGAETVDVTFAITNMQADAAPDEATADGTDGDTSSTGEGDQNTAESGNPLTLTVEASTTMNLAASENAVIKFASDTLQIDEMQVTVTGIKQGEDLDLTLNAVADVKLSQYSNPVLTMVNDIFGLTKLHFALEAHSPAGDAETETTENDLDVSLTAAAQLDLSTSTNSVMVFLKDLLGVANLTMDLLVAVAAESGSEAQFDVVAQTVINLGESNSPFFTLLHDFLDIETVTINLSLGQSAITLNIALDMDKELVPGALKILNAAVGMTLEQKPLTVGVYMGLTFEITMPKEPNTDEQDILTLSGSVGVYGIGTPPLTVSGTLAMPGNWETPFGLPGVLIADLSAMVGIVANSPYLNEIGLAGRLQIGETDLKTAIYINREEPHRSGVVASGQNITLANIVNSLAGPDTMSEELEDAFNYILQVNNMELRLVPPGGFTINDTSYTDEGVTAQVDLSLLGWDVYGYLRVDYSNGLEIHGALEGFEIAGGLVALGRPEEGVLVIDPEVLINDPDNENPAQDQIDLVLPPALAEYDKGGPLLYAKLSPFAQPACYLMAEVTLLGMTQTIALAFVNDELRFHIERDLFGLFSASLTCAAKTDLSYIHVVGILKQSFLDALKEAAQEALKKVEEAVDDAQNTINEEQQRLESEKQAELERLKQEIADREKELQDDIEAKNEAFDKAEAAVKAAEKDLAWFDREIRDLEDEYDSLPDADWPWEESKARDGAAIKVAIIALEVFREIAEGVLELAQKTLDGIDKVTDDFMESDIMLIDLMAEKVAIETGTDIAQDVLEFTEDVVGGLGDVAAFVMETGIALTEVFNVREVRFEGAYYSAHQDTSKAKEVMVSMSVEFTFLGNDHYANFTMDLNNLEKGAGILLDELAKATGISFG